MDGPPTYAGTKGREPCPACNGAGAVQRLGLPLGQLELCIACNGTRVRPVSSPVAAARRSGRIAGIRRAQAGR